MSLSPHRRAVLRLLAGAAGLLPWTARPQDALRDRGIGGTGLRTNRADDPPLGSGDRGIGGTGVIGTIRRFGSIVVNDLRIAYPQDVAVRIDGEPATAAALKLGQVVQVLAHRGQGGLTTQRIDIVSEVVGPVESATPGRLIVLGQRVLTAGLAGEWTQGTRVAVSGLRRPDGVIVASLVEPRPSGPDRVAGLVRREGDGTLAIGGLRLAGADALPPGQRALVTGTSEAGTLRVNNAAQTGIPFPPGLQSLSIEAYIGRAGSKLELGSGLAVTGQAGPAVPKAGSVRAVVTARVAPDGELTVERLRAQERIAPQPSDRGNSGGQGPSRFQYEPDHLDFRSPPETQPGRFGQGSGGPNGGRLDIRGGDIRAPGDAGGPPRGPDFTPEGAMNPRVRVPGVGPPPNSRDLTNPVAPGFLGPGGGGGPPGGFRR